MEEKACRIVKTSCSLQFLNREPGNMPELHERERESSCLLDSHIHIQLHHVLSTKTLPLHSTVRFSVVVLHAGVADGKANLACKHRVKNGSPQTRRSKQQSEGWALGNMEPFGLSGRFYVGSSGWRIGFSKSHISTSRLLCTPEGLDSAHFDITFLDV